MNNDFLESRKAVAQAREALRLGDRTAALKWAQEAARLAPHSEDPWLILAAIASPQASVDYIKKALEANPESPRARRAMLWAMQRLQQGDAQPPAGSLAPAATEIPEPASPKARKTPRLLFPALLAVLGCLVLIAAAWSAVRNPALASIWSAGAPSQPLPTAERQSWAQAELPKPTLTATLFAPPAPTELVLLPPEATAKPGSIAGAEPTLATEPPVLPESTATTAYAQIVEPGSTLPSAVIVEPAATQESAVLVDPVYTPGVLQAAIVQDTPTSEYVAPAPIPQNPNTRPASIAAAVYGERWIDVDLSQQMVYAYEGDTLMNSFLVSTGTWQTPTVTGTYKVWIKLKSTTMTGPGYYLPNVPYTMYFYKGYGLHGTYWHNNFGTPMSHGCVNLSIPDSEWLYNFASVGTTVNVHY